jgi:hypothetical protein
MRALSHLFFKVTLSSMIVSAPAMTTGSNTDANYGVAGEKGATLSFNSSAVIKRFVNYNNLVFSPLYSGHEEFVNAEKLAGAERLASTERPAAAEKLISAEKPAAEKPVSAEKFAGAEKLADAVKFSDTKKLVSAEKPAVTEKLAIAEKSAVTEKLAIAEKSAVTEKLAVAKEVVSVANSAATENLAGKFAARRAELNMVISQAVFLYDRMNLQRSGLDEKAFEYAWRGYHNLLKKGLIRKKNVLSICDFSQSSRNKRMYVIDIRHQKLLYRTYVAHGQNSGAEFADSFSNQPDSYKSSLGFYVTSKTYYGRNGLSLKIEGLDSGYNDLAGRRNIVLHGCAYAGAKYLHHYGSLGTSLGCPAIPSSMSPRIIQVVKHGSVLFIYHPTQEYLDGSSVINSDI